MVIKHYYTMKFANMLIRLLTTYLKYHLLIVHLIFYFGCTNNYNYKSDKIFIQTFNQDEIIGITTLINYTDSLVKINTNQIEINKAYHEYFDNLKDSMFDSNYIIPITNELKFKYLKNINQNTINEFWHLYSFVDSVQVTNPERMTININGKFMNYISKVGRIDTTFKVLHTNILSMGDISRTELIRYFSNNDSIDFHIMQNRMLAMVCIFSIFEMEKRKTYN